MSRHSRFKMCDWKHGDLCIFLDSYAQCTYHVLGESDVWDYPLFTHIILGAFTKASEGNAGETHENSSAVEWPTTTVENIRQQLQQFRWVLHVIWQNGIACIRHVVLTLDPFLWRSNIYCRLPWSLFRTTAVLFCEQPSWSSIFPSCYKVWFFYGKSNEFLKLSLLFDYCTRPSSEWQSDVGL